MYDSMILYYTILYIELSINAYWCQIQRPQQFHHLWDWPRQSDCQPSCISPAAQLSDSLTLDQSLQHSLCTAKLARQGQRQSKKKYARLNAHIWTSLSHYFPAVTCCLSCVSYSPVSSYRLSDSDSPANALREETSKL